MKRRRLLAGLAVGLASAAGCSEHESADGSPGATRTESGSAPGTSPPTSEEADTGTTESPTEEETATGEPRRPVRIEHQQFVVEETDFDARHAVTGSVVNGGPDRLSTVEVRATFTDEEGDQVGTNFTTVLDLPAGETWETWVPLLSGGEPADGDLAISEVDGTPAGRWPDGVELERHRLAKPDGEYGAPEVTGRVTNGTDGTVEYLEARVRFYAADGTVLGSDRAHVTEFGGGESWEFTVPFSPYNEEWGSRVESHEVRLVAN